MTETKDYRMHPDVCSLFNDNPKIAFAVLASYVTFEKKIAKAKRELNAELKEIFAPFEHK